MVPPQRATPLVLARAARVADLLPRESARSWEASGILVHGGRLHVVFDGERAVAVLPADLAPTGELVALPDGPGRGYEDLAFDPGAGHFLLLVEAVARGAGWMAQVEEYDETFAPVSRAWLDFPLPSANKGLEGLTCVRRAGTTYLLGLCEGNRCERGERGRQPGGGRVQVFVRGDGTWPHVATVRLPGWLPFRDYAALAADGDRLAVVSQESSAVWFGRLAAEGWSVLDDGVVREFPRDRNGDVAYCTVEGLAWLGPTQLAAVSDRSKRGEHGRGCRATEESVHVFDVP